MDNKIFDTDFYKDLYKEHGQRRYYEGILTGIKYCVGFSVVITCASVCYFGRDNLRFRYFD